VSADRTPHASAGAEADPREVFELRCWARAVPDAEHAGMWRSSLGRGELSDMASLAWAKNAVLVAAERELEFEDRTRCAIDPSKSQHSGVFFGGRRR
jgi:hypothetical protein